MKNKLFILIGSILFVFCFIVLFKGLQKKNIYTPELKLEKDLPIFVSNDFFSEEQVSSEDIFKNDNYYVINIWASWCIPCKEEHSFLLNLKNKNIELIGINYKDNENSALQFLKELGNPYKKILKDREGVLSIELGAYGVPETFIINKQKKIIKKIIGPINDEIYNEILSLIK